MLATAGCLAHGQVVGGAQVSADPMLVELRPGVWVVEDYGEPVFYADGYFWLYRGDGWYRSSDHTRGWVHFGAAPQVIVSIERPRQYVHYRAAPGHRVRRGPSGPITTRDHRDDAPAVPDRGPGRPDRRDQPQARHEEKREEQQVKREDKAEQREEKREEKHEEKREHESERVEYGREEKAPRADHKADHKADRKADDKGDRKGDHKPDHKPRKK